MSTSAQKRGQNLLDKFASAKRSDGGSNPASASKRSQNDDDSAYDPNTEGSFLRGLQFGESKDTAHRTPVTAGAKRVSLSMSAPNTAATLGTQQDDESSPLEMVRFAMLQLNSMAGDEQIVESVTSMLQGVEEYLEQANARKMQSRMRAAARVSEIGSGSLLHTPQHTPGDAMHRSQRSILLENQLDLNESEMEYYEQIVNDLVLKLEKLNEERDELAEKADRLAEEKEELQDVSSSLGTRLQSLAEQKQQLETRVSTVESEREEYESRIKQLEHDLSLADKAFNNEKVRTAQLESDLKELKADARSSGRRSSGGGTDSDNRGSGEGVAAVVEELREINRDLEAELEDCHSEIDNMSSLVEDLRLRLDRGEGPETDAEIVAQLQAATALTSELKSQLQIKDAAILAMHKQQEALNNRIVDLDSQIELKNHEIVAFKQQQIQSATTPHTTRPPQESPQQSLTNAFLGITSSVDSDDEAATAAVAASSSTPLASASFSVGQWDSFHSTADHVLRRNDVDELKQVIAERDRQIKVHIAQLQAQQDSLTELKNAISMLKKQKSGLRDALNDSNSKIDDIKQRELSALNRANELQNYLDDELLHIEELKLSLQEADTRSNELQSLVNDLMKKTASYRKQIDEGSGGGGSVHTTPAKAGKHVTIAPTGAEVALPLALPSPGLSNMQHRLALAESQVDELTAQLRMSEKRRDDTQLEFDKLQVRFQAKARQSEEQTHEIISLRADLDAATVEIDQLKIKEMKFEANSKLSQIDNESEIEILSGRINTLEKQLAEQREKLRNKESEVGAEAEASRALRDVLRKLGDKDDTTEELLNQLRNERQQAIEEAEAASQALQTRQSELQICQEQCRELEQELDAIVQQKQALEGAMKQLQNTVNILQLGNSEGTQLLQERIKNAEEECTRVDEALEYQKQLTANLENELTNRSAELAITKRALGDVAELVQYYDARLQNIEEVLVDRVSQELAAFDIRLDGSTWALQKATDDFARRTADAEEGKYLAESTLRDTQLTLQKALQRHEEDAEEKAAALRDLAELQSVEIQLREQLDEANAQLADRIDMSASQENVAQQASEDALSLKQQLREAEHRAEQLSAESAHMFAENARNVAYLESENARLSDLVNHLRGESEQLAAQLKESQERGQHCISLEHRLKRMEEEESTLQDRLRANEAVIVKKEKDLLELLNNAREQEDQRNEYFGSEMSTLSKQLKDAHDKVHALLAEKKAITDSHQQRDTATKLLIETLEEKLRATERDVNYQQGRVDDLEFELRNVQTTLQDKEHQLSQHSTKLLLLQEESAISAETHADAVKELKSEIEEKHDTIRSLDEQISALKQKLRTLEEEFLQRDEEIAAKLMKRAAADDENRQLRHQLEHSTLDNGELRRRNEQLEAELESKTADLETANNDVTQLKADLNEAENDLEQLQHDNRELTEQVSSQQQQLESSQEAFSEAREALRQSQQQMERLEDDFADVKAAEVKLKAHNESLNSNNVYLRKQLDELMPKLAKSQSDCNELRSTNSEQLEQIRDLENHAEDCEARLKQMRASFEAFDIAEADILSGMREVGDVLSSKTGTDPLLKLGNATAATATAGSSSNSSVAQRTPGPAAAAAVRCIGGSSSSSNSSNATEGHFHIGTDLFSSPPLAVTRSPVNLYSDAVNNTNLDLTADSIITQSEALASIKQGIALLRIRSANLASAYHSTYESLDNSRREKDELQKEFDKLKDKLQFVSFDCEKLEVKNSKAEEEVSGLKKRLLALESEKDVWLNADQSNNQRMNTVLRDMDNTLLEAVAVANDAVAGIVPINAEALPNLSISQSLIEQNDAIAAAVATSSSSLTLRSVGAAAVPTSGTSAITVLSVTVNEVDRVAGYLNNIIVKLVNECKSKSDALTAAEEQIENAEANWSDEREELISNAARLQEDIDQLQSEVANLNADLESAQNETERVQAKIPKLQSANAELDAEKKQVIDQLHGLRMQLQASENIVLDLRSKNRILQVDSEKRQLEFSAMNDQLLDSRRRITDSELSQEKFNAQLARLKAEKDALDNVRKSLETELERAHAESANLREQMKLLDEEHRSAFEVEKLLAALGNTLDQVLPAAATTAVANAATSGSANNSSNMQNSSMDRYHSHQQQQQVQLMNSTAGSAHSVMSDFENETVPMRVDVAVKRLTQLRSWAREEARRRRAVEGELANAAEELTTAQSSADEAREQLKQAMQNVTEREQELRSKNKEVEELQYELQKLRNEMNRTKLEQSTSVGMLEDEKRSTDSLRDEIRTREGQVARLQGDLDQRSNTVAKLQEQLRQTSSQLSDAVAEAQQRAEQLRAAKANSERLMETMEQMERGIEEDRRERDQSERRLLEAETQASVLSRTKARSAELERQLAKAKEEQRQMALEKAVVEEKQLAAQKELEQSRKKLHSLENRINAVMMEKNNFVDEVAETRRKIALAKEFAEQEREKRMEADAAIEALRRSGEEQRVDLVGFATQSEDLETLQLRAEDEKRSLRTKITELRLACEEKESQRIADASDRRKLEKDVKQLKSALAKRNAELESSSNYSSLLRSEGRHARQQVMQAVGSIRELMKMVRLDAQAAGVAISSPARDGISSRAVAVGAAAEESIPNKSSISYDEALSLGLAEALGINDLAQALSVLRDGMTYLTTAPENRRNLLERVRELEEDNTAMLRELQSSESQRSELVSRYKEEIHTMHTHITELRRTDSKNPHLMHQISVLESALKQERDRSRKAAADAAALKSRMDQMTRGLTAPHQRSSDGVFQVEIAALRKELDKHKAENSELSHEVNAINYHRTVLRDTIEQLERQLKEQADVLGQLQAQLERTGGDFQVSALGALLDVSSPIGSPMTSAINSPVRGVAPQQQQQQQRSKIAAAMMTATADGTTGGVMSEDDEDALKRQVMRYKVRSAALEQLATSYRTSVLALYADGASYGAAQYGWQPHGLPQEFSSRGLHLIGVGWIEREMNAVKHSFEDEIRVLDAEVAELRAKLKQRNSYIIELRKSFEENLKGIFGSNGGKRVTDSYVEQFEQLRQALEKAHGEGSSLQQELMQERADSRQRHQQLVERLTKSLQSRDAALGALKRLEQFCVDKGLDIHGLAIYETLKSEMSAAGTDGSPRVKRVYSNNSLQNSSGAVQSLRSRSNDSNGGGNEFASSLSSLHQQAQQNMQQQQQQQQAIAQLMRGLVEADHELVEAERRRTARSRQPAAAGGGVSSGHSSRSNSRTRSSTPTTTVSAATAASQQQRASNLPRPQNVQRNTPLQQQQQQRSDSFVEEQLTRNFLASHQPQQSGAGDASYQLPNVGSGGGSGSLRVSNRRGNTSRK